MKILIVSDYGAPRGGNEIVTLALLDGLRARGHDTRLLSSSAYPDAQGIVDYQCYGTASRARAALWCANPSAYWVLKRALTEFQPDVVHVRLFLSQLSPLILPLLRRVPTVYHDGWYRTVCPIGSKVLPDGTACTAMPGAACLRSNCVPVAAWPLAMTQLSLWRRWRSVFDAVVANSHAVADWLRRSGIASVDVIYNGVPDLLPVSQPSDAPLIGYSGRLSSEKGVDVLLHAFRRVKEVVPDACLIIAGDGPEQQRLERLATQVGGDIRFLGQLAREAVAQHFGRIWVQVAPSRGAEAFGNTAAEAMMRGCAIVASNAGGYSEYIEHQQTGVLVPPGDSVALADALIPLLQSRTDCQKLGQAARLSAQRLFDQTRFLTQFESVYARLTSA